MMNHDKPLDIFLAPRFKQTRLHDAPWAWCNNQISQPPGCPLGPFPNEPRWTWWWDWWQANHTPAMSWTTRWATHPSYNRMADHRFYNRLTCIKCQKETAGSVMRLKIELAYIIYYYTISIWTWLNMYVCIRMYKEYTKKWVWNSLDMSCTALVPTRPGSLHVISIWKPGVPHFIWSQWVV